MGHQKIEIRRLREENENLKSCVESLKVNNKELEHERDNLKKEFKWSQRQNVKLQGEI